MEARTEYLDEKDKAEARQTMINRLLASLGGLGSTNSEPTSGGGSYEEINTAKYNSAGINVAYGDIGTASSGDLTGINWWYDAAPRSAPAMQRAVVPNNAGRAQSATTNAPYWTGTVVYRQGGFILGGGTFSGTVVGPNGQRGTVTGYVVSAGLQIGTYDGSVQAKFSGSPSGPSTGTNGGFFSGQIDIAYGPVQIAQVGGNMAAYVGHVNADLGAFTPNNSGPRFSTNTSPTDPGGYLDTRLGLGGALGFNVFVVTGFNPIP